MANYKAGMSNVWPAGRMRPANGLNAARKMIFSYVMHAARERMKYIKHAACEMILQSIKKLRNELYIYGICPKMFLMAFFF